MDFETDVIRTVTFKLILPVVILYLVAYIDQLTGWICPFAYGCRCKGGDAAYGLGAGLFFIGYFLFEVPSNLLLDKFGARKWFTRILLTQDLITMAMALIQGPPSFLSLKVFTRCSRRVFSLVFLYLITQWYPVRHREKSWECLCFLTTNCHDDCRAHFSWSITWNGWHCKFTRLAMVVCCS